MSEPNYRWPARDKRRVMGTRVNRIDGPAKVSGRGKYGSDINQPGMLFAALLTCPHAHARVRSVDIKEAQALKGVTAVEVMSGPGTVIQWAGTEVAAVAALTEEIARDAVRRIKVDYEVLSHAVKEEDLKAAGGRSKPAGEVLVGDPDDAFKKADVISEGEYGIPVLQHCCLEPHGQVVMWKGDTIEYWPSTQNVSGIGGDLAQSLSIPAANVHVRQDHVGGGFGSKFSADRWGVVAAKLSKASGGRPVKLFLDRRTELEIAGSRPSGFARIRLGARKDGTIIAWESQSWGTSGPGGGGVAATQLPYVFVNIPNKRVNHTGVITHTGPARAWRAPNHPQASFLTCCAIEDLAAKLNLDPLEVFDRNFQYTARPEVYRAQLRKAAELSEWEKLWHPRGQAGPGPVKRGLGIGVATWGGLGHASDCRTTIHPDGSVEVELGSQDLGTGTRTVIAMVAAETLGLSVGQIQVKIGDNRYPPSGGSGGSTTVGGVAVSTRKSTMNALQKLLEAVAPALGVSADQLEAVDGRIQVRGNPAKSLTWKAACQKLGVKPIVEMGRNDPKNPMGMISQGVGGIQIADVSVDVETGVVKLNRLVAVQDCGLIINPKTAESQVYGACIMSICGALFEERIMCQQTGRFLNADMEFYKLAGIDDIGEIIVHLDITPEHDARGVIGLGEPPVVPGIAAIANAVANAIGVRVPRVPLTPDRVLAALEGRRA
ncbi:MAG: xanthine dehydrogenase family protein molybdopterin-binding subunit [Bryobacterales bacterium]|nr:xanthine dehydrogenase family protein molybdopterin-binding subunit [Bryobacteraceae bacterium]MDW8356138.1 xanthine dehydrogenase family protein molybdopterin-binding subunit [Bryobacterales bacterium]